VTPNPPRRRIGALRVLWPFVRGQRVRLAGIAVLSLLGGLAEAVVLVIIAKLGVVLAAGDDRFTASLGTSVAIDLSVGVTLAVAAGLVLVRVGTLVVGAHIGSNAISEVRRRLRSDLMAEYLRASWELQSQERPGRLQELATTFVTTTANAVGGFALLVVSFSSLLIFVLTALAVNAVAAISVALAALGMGALLEPLRRRVRRTTHAASRANLEYATDVNELATLLREVRIFAVEEPALRRIGASIDRAATVDRRATFAGQLGTAVYQGVALLFVLGAIAVVWASGVSGLASFGAIILIMLRSLSYGQAAHGQLQALEGSGAVIGILEEERARFTAAAVPRTGKPLTSIGEIRFEHVGFDYEPGVRVLADLSFTVPHGEIVGIVGPSGAGKSTLVQVLLRLRDPTVGRMTVDGLDAAQFARADWFRRVSFVPQDARLFAGTIAENIAFLRDDLDRAAIEHAAQLANLHDEVVAMPDGYDQFVGEGGARLSGGQRQRLCIARALAEDPDVLVLDEPTSALDVRSEVLIRRAVAAVAPRATVFVIAHRLSTLEICDRIMVIHEGRLQGFEAPGYLEQHDPFYREALALSGLR
jgi:ABC-type multidrug transport system fused ATPase/permease subunit